MNSVLNFFFDFLVNSATLDLILAGVVLEGAALLAYRHYTGRGLAPRAVFANLLSGGSLMLALRLSLDSGVLGRDATTVIALCLAVALVAHVADLAARWDSRPGSALAPGSRT